MIWTPFCFQEIPLLCNTLLKSNVTTWSVGDRCRGSQECGSRNGNFACKFHWRWHAIFGSSHNSEIYINSAVYTCIKKPESFSHSGFSLKVARQLPLNTPKNPNRKTHLRSVIFWNSAEISLVFCQCKRSLQSRRYYSGFWSRGTWPSAESPDRGPRRNAHYTCTVKGREKSRMRTTYQNTSMRFGFFRACAFRAKNPECYGFFWQCKRYNKKPRFFGFWFLPM